MSIAPTKPSAFTPCSRSSAAFLPTIPESTTAFLPTIPESTTSISSSKKRKIDLCTKPVLTDRAKTAFNVDLEEILNHSEKLKEKSMRRKMTYDYPHFFALLERKFRLGGGGKFCLEKYIGSGAHGVVYKATDVDGKEHALKIADHDHKFEFEGEIEHLQLLKDASNLSHYVDSFSTTVRASPSTKKSTRFHVLALEYIPKPTLHDSVIKSDKKLSLAQLGAIAWQTLEGLKTFEEKGVVHCDLKPANILGKEEPSAADIGDNTLQKAIKQLIVTIIDLGGSEKIGLIKPGSQPLAFKSPATTMGAPLSHNNDLFSLGCTLYYLLTKKLHFEYQSLSIRLPLDLDKKNYIILLEQLLYIGMPSSDFLDTCKFNKFFEKINGSYRLKTNFFPQCYLSTINDFARGFVDQINTQYKKAEASLKEEEKGLFPLFKDLIATLLDYRKQKTVQEMQDHPFFTQLKQI